MPQCDLDEMARAVSAVGFVGIGLCEELLDGQLERAGAILDASGLTATICQTRVRSVFPFAGDAGAFESGAAALDAREAEIVAGMRRLAPLQPATYVVLPGVPIGYATDAQADAVVVSTLKRLAREAVLHGARIAFEPVHPSVRDLFGYVTTLRHGLEIVAGVGDPSVGLLLDTWHLAEDPDAMTLTKRQVAQVGGVHLADRVESETDWRHRTLPGHGFLPVNEVVQRLDAMGYRGCMDLELISDDGRLGLPTADSYWTLGASTLAEQLWGSVEALSVVI